MVILNSRTPRNAPSGLAWARGALWVQAVLLVFIGPAFFMFVSALSAMAGSTTEDHRNLTTWFILLIGPAVVFHVLAAIQLGRVERGHAYLVASVTFSVVHILFLLPYGVYAICPAAPIVVSVIVALVGTNRGEANRLRQGLQPVEDSPHSKRVEWIVVPIGATLIAVLLIGNALSVPPNSNYTQAEAYAPMETAVVDAIAVLPDFPGFGRRMWAQMPCSHDGIDDPDYTNIEIRYEFSLENSETELVRERYVDELREFWTSLGYEITTDEATTRGDRVDYALIAEREDGIVLWYRVVGYVVFTIHSGCVPVSDASEFEYIPPAAGIEPGSESDLVEEYFPDGIPTDQAAAIDPFAEAQAVPGPVAFNSPYSYDGLI